MTPRTLIAPLLLEADEWRLSEAAHHDEVDQLTAAHRERQFAGKRHPVEDFLFTYYPYKPRHLRRWHAGVGTVLLGESALSRLEWKGYARTGKGVSVDVAKIHAKRGQTWDYVYGLLSATQNRPAHWGCFGLHEWAMVYRDPESLRHDLPLRLGQSATDRVVESHRVDCTHYDAFRFFTTPARPLNLTVLTREGQRYREQPGCLHAGMDLYKWAWKLEPLVPGELLLRCFRLAADIRLLDMKASPYDLSEFGEEPVPIETAEGKAEYLRQQKAFAERANVLRDELLGVIDTARSLLDTAHE